MTDFKLPVWYLRCGVEKRCAQAALSCQSCSRHHCWDHPYPVGRVIYGEHRTLACLFCLIEPLLLVFLVSRVMLSISTCFFLPQLINQILSLYKGTSAGPHVILSSSPIWESSSTFVILLHTSFFWTHLLDPLGPNSEAPGEGF